MRNRAATRATPPPALPRCGRGTISERRRMSCSISGVVVRRFTTSVPLRRPSNSPEAPVADPDRAVDALAEKRSRRFRTRTGSARRMPASYASWGLRSSRPDRGSVVGQFASSINSRTDRTESDPADGSRVPLASRPLGGRRRRSGRRGCLPPPAGREAHEQYCVILAHQRVVDHVLDGSLRQLDFKLVQGFKSATALVIASDAASARNMSHEVVGVQGPVRIVIPSLGCPRESEHDLRCAHALRSVLRETTDHL
jgi:hypothetical protein